MKRKYSAALGLLLTIPGCAEWQPSGSLASPDGKTIAQVEVALAEAPAGNKTRIVIRNGKGSDLPKPVYVVEADNAIVGFTRLRWMSANRLQVVLCEATSFRVSAENMRDPPFVDAGRGDGVGVPNAVWVEVSNLAYSEIAKRCVLRDKAS